MFKKSGNTADVKKSQLKCIDLKRDTPTRLKHLKAVLENGDLADSKTFLEANYSPAFHLFYESFITTESNLKQKATFAVQRSHPEELECCLFILEKILCLLPELLRQRWQCHSLTHIFRKLLHPSNSFRLRRENMKLYILWYMVVGENKSPEMDRMFASLVPTFPVPPQAIYESEVASSKCVPIEPSPVIAAHSGEKLPEDVAGFMLKSLLDAMVFQVRKIEWKEKHRQNLKSFSYLMKMFRSIYLPYIFPNFNSEFSIYKPSIDLPELRSSRSISNPYATCQVVLIDWIRKYVGTIQHSRRNEPISGSFEDGRKSVHGGEVHDANSFIDQDSLVFAYKVPDDSMNFEDYRFVRDFLFSTRENVNFVHEIFRQALRLSFRHASTMKEVVLCYHEWIKMTSQDIPTFLLDQVHGHVGLDNETEEQQKVVALLDRDAVRAGLQNVLQVFVTSASNVFLLVVPEDFPRLLDEQVDLCKLVLNIYRYMVMHTRMERRTWEQLLIVLFHITSLTLKNISIASKVDTLGGRFASALFQTLVVSCIKANLSVVISPDLWDQLLTTLQGLTHWDELIKEWSKTMETLTKVLARHVYGLELSNLPLERMTERKALKRAATKLSGLESAKNTLSKGWDLRKAELVTSEESKYGEALNRKEGRANMSHLGQSMDQGTYKTGFSRSPFSQKRRSSCDSSSSYCRPGGSITDSFSRFYLPRPHWRPRRRIRRSFSDPSIHKRNVSYWENGILFSRSLDNLLGGDYDSRCHSPTSSGIDAASLKESPVPIDIGGDTTSIDTLDDGASTEQRSVMAGGSVRGWLPDVAVVLWRRVLGILGDPNQVEDPAVHELIFNSLLSLTSTLIKIRENLGISLDNQTTPESPELVPPLTLLSSWCFEAFDLPPKYNKGKLVAYRLLCRVVVRKHDIPLSKEFISSFYQCLHQALVGSDQEVINTLVFECGPHFFSLGLPGATILTLDFICASSSVISVSDPKTVSPRLEALGLLGSLFPLSSLYSSMPVLQPTPTDVSMMNCADVRDHLLNTLLKSGKRDSHLKTRCLALSILAVWLYHELGRRDGHSKVFEIANVLMGSLKAGRLASQVSADLLLLLADYAEVFLLSYADLPLRIIQVLCQTLAAQCGDVNIGSNKEAQHIVLSMLFCLAEWVMRLPQYILVQPAHDGKPILHLVFKVLNYLSVWMKPSAADLRSMGINSASEGKDDLAKSAMNAKMSKKPNTYADPATIKLASRAVTNHLVNQLWHFPLGVGAQRLSSTVVEADDLPGQTGEELTSEIFLSPHVQLFSLNGSCLLSLVQLPALNVPGGASTAGFKTPNSEVRLILRDLSGKFSWDASILYGPPATDYPDSCPSVSPEPIRTSLNTASSVGDLTSSMVITTPPRHAVRHRQPDRLPTLEDSADDLDNLDDLLSYISHTSPEIVETSCVNTAFPLSVGGESQHEAISTILSQRNAEKEYQTISTNHPTARVPKEQPPAPVESDSVFQQCRKFIDHLGLDSFERRKSISTLHKNDKLLRELKNLDNQKCRETHKVAVIYVAEGQEDKSSILANNAGSEEFEEFVGGLGWEVELGTHTGFLGGLQRNGLTGETAPYYATSLTEAIFHVSTRMPSHTDENLFQKVRHLGNDEVHVVWSEHTRDYRRGIIQTEFCDVLIAIYPMTGNLCRIQISTKSDIPFFGPLFNGAIVNRKVVSPLVRATALNASRAKRSKLPYYQHFYEERSRALATIIENHSESTSFEQFVSAVYCPFSLNGIGSGLSGRYGRPSQGVSQSGLAAALLDGPNQSSPRPPMSRPTSYSVGEKHNMREKVRNALGTDSPPRMGEATPPPPRGGGKRQSIKIPKGIHSPIAPPRKGRDYPQPNNYKDK